MTGQIDREIITKVERDLRCYPDWIVRLEVGGLGIPSHALKIAGDTAPNLSSLVEYDAELSDEIKRKVIAIEKVYDRMHGKMKDLIEYRYFQGYGRDEVRRMLGDIEKHMPMGKRWYYELRDRAVECFARALGYIE